MYLHIFINKYFRTSWFSSNHSSSDTRINQWNWWYYWSEHSSVDWRSERWWAQDEVGEFTEIIQVHDSSDEEEFEHFWEEWIPQRKKIKGNEWDRSDWFTNSSFALAKIDNFRFNHHLKVTIIQDISKIKADFRVSFARKLI